MENGAFTAGPADSPSLEGAAPAGQFPPLEMKPQHSREEKQPLCHCDKHCACLEENGKPAGRGSSVQVKSWSRTKTVVMVIGVVALAVWCGVMAAMYHYGVL